MAISSRTRIYYAFYPPGKTEPEYECSKLASSLFALKNDVIAELQDLGHFPGECRISEWEWEITSSGHRIVLWSPEARRHTQAIRNVLEKVLPPPTETT